MKCVPIPIFLAKASVAFLGSRQPRLGRAQYAEGPTAHTGLLSVGEQPQPSYLASWKFSEAAGHPYYKQQLLHGHISIAHVRDPKACSDCWLHRATEAFCLTLQDTNGRQALKVKCSRAPCLLFHSNVGLGSSGAMIVD